MGSRVVLDGVATWTTFFSIASLSALPQIHTAKVSVLCKPKHNAWTISSAGTTLYPHIVRIGKRVGAADAQQAVEPNSTC